MKDINLEFCYDVMTTAVYGAIQYWAYLRGMNRVSLFDARLLSLTLEERPEEEDHPITKTLLAKDIDAAVYKILHGEVHINPDIAAQFVGYPGNPDAGQVDAVGADCAVQIAMFGEIKYG